MEHSVLIQAVAPTEVVVLGIESLLKQTDSASSSWYVTFELSVCIIFNIHQKEVSEAVHIHLEQAAVIFLILLQSDADLPALCYNNSKDSWFIWTVQGATC